MRVEPRSRSRHMINATLDLEKLAYILREYHGRYISPWELARIIPVSTRTAGKILARMEELGLIRRYNNRGIYEMI